MHSFGMAKDILRTVLTEADKHNGERIEAICIKVDEHDFSEAESLQFCMEGLAKKGTLAEGARIEIELADAAMIDLPSVVLRLN